MRAVVAHADEVAPDVVGHGMRAELRERVQLGHRLAERERLAQANAGRHDLADERVERLDAERGEHLALLSLVRAEMAAGELAAAEERCELAHTPAAFAYSSRAMSSASSFLSLTLSLKSQPFS